MIKDNISLKAKLTRLRNEKIKISKELEELENTCEHHFIWGYTLEPVIFCEICNKDATDIFPNMHYKHIEKLVDNGK